VHAFISPLPQKKTCSCPYRRPIIFTIFSKFIREVELNPIMVANRKKISTILGWQQVPPNVHGNRTVAHHMNGGFLEL
jgi:hypothetical protein